MVKCLPEFEYFTVFLKNRNFISKIRRSEVTDYAALKHKNMFISPIGFLTTCIAMHHHLETV